MDHANDMDPVLRSLGADLERDDPELAALLSDAPPPPVSRPRDHTGRWFGLAARRLFGLLALEEPPSVHRARAYRLT